MTMVRFRCLASLSFERGDAETAKARRGARTVGLRCRAAFKPGGAATPPYQKGIHLVAAGLLFKNSANLRDLCVSRSRVNGVVVQIPNVGQASCLSLMFDARSRFIGVECPLATQVGVRCPLAIYRSSPVFLTLNPLSSLALARRRINPLARGSFIAYNRESGAAATVGRSCPDIGCRDGAPPPYQQTRFR